MVVHIKIGVKCPHLRLAVYCFQGDAQSEILKLEVEMVNFKYYILPGINRLSTYVLWVIGLGMIAKITNVKS